MTPYVTMPRKIVLSLLLHGPKTETQLAQHLYKSTDGLSLSKLRAITSGLQTYSLARHYKNGNVRITQAGKKFLEE